jgi:two-component system response regulator PilR (NtrC family)
MKRILVVDDEPSMQEVVGIMLRKEGFDVVLAGSRGEAAEALAACPVDMVITDIKLPDGDGLEILRHVKAGAPDTCVVVMTAYGSTRTAVAALKMGAHDYLIKPFDMDELKFVVRNALEKQQLQAENLRFKAEFRAHHGLDKIIGVSPAMAAVFDLVRTVCSTGSTVLITGESGTGKELVAKAIHALSPRTDHPFVSVNCGALQETLLESELFGHVKGAFTDAVHSRKGLFAAAHRGTLFLDEVGETTLVMQVKLLRALQEKRVRPVGGTAEVEVDVRVVAATNQSLEALVREKRFRNDLYYRLNVIPIRVPPLRERRTDVPLLAEHFLVRVARDMGKQVTGISAEAMSRMTAYDWPGNVRELENVIERAVALEPTPVILPERLPEAVRIPRSEPAATGLQSGFDLDGHLRSLEAGFVRQALEETRGSRAEAAQRLGISPRSLRYLVRKHGVGSDEK